MFDVIQWLVVSEILTLAAIPLAFWVFGSLPDRGFAFAKLLGLVLVTWAIWWLGNFLAIGTYLALPWILLLALGVFGWLAYHRSVFKALLPNLGLIGLEELLFLAGFVGWAVMRSLHPDIPGTGGTEKPMDLMMLQASYHTSTFPPQDLWLAGHGINYYYFGYLFLSELGRMAGTSVFVTFNLSLAWLFGAALAGTYCISYNLIRRKGWSLLGPVFVVLLGNAHALFIQVLDGQFPWNQTYWFWESTRIVGETAPGQANTINEFPFFSFILGDLHPHLIDIPVALMAIAFALAIYFAIQEDARHRAEACSRENTAGPTAIERPWLYRSPLSRISPWHKKIIVHPGRLAVIAIGAGALFATNSWDFPTYLALMVASLLLGVALNSEKRNIRANLSAGGITASLLVLLSVLAFLPFFIDYHSPVQGIGAVTTVTNPGQAGEIFASFGFLVLCFLAFTSWRAGLSASLRRMARSTGGVTSSSGSNGPILILAIAFIAALGLAAIAHRWVLFTGIALADASMWLAWEGVRCRLRGSTRKSRVVASKVEIGTAIQEATTTATDELVSDGFLLLLCALSALLLVATELVYLRDIFDSSALYRMNTVFKLYYQIWILLGIAGAYIAGRLAMALRHVRRALLAGWVVCIFTIITIGGIYTILGPLSYYGDPGGGPIAFALHPLNGLETMASQDPQDLRAIEWLRSHVHGHPIILEATGGDYTDFARVSTFTGLPTLLGWEGHEQQWRGYPPVLQERHQAIDEIYSTGSPSVARQLLLENHVSIVYIGPCEREIYASGPSVCGSSTPVSSPSNALTKFRSFMKQVYDDDGVQIYEMCTT